MLKNKISVITGATRGIGFATSLEFARQGSVVVMLGRSEESLKLASTKILFRNTWRDD